MVNDNMPAMLSKTYGSGLSTSAEKALLQHHVPASAVLNKCFKFNPATPLNYSSPSLDRVLNKRLITSVYQKVLKRCFCSTMIQPSATVRR